MPSPCDLLIIFCCALGSQRVRRWRSSDQRGRLSCNGSPGPIVELICFEGAVRCFSHLLDFDDYVFVLGLFFCFFF